MIRIDNLTRCFGSKLAVDNLSLVVPQGKILGFLGPNGAGKTTTIRMMVGLLRPTSGTIQYGNSSDCLDILRNNLAVRKKIGYIPDSPFLYEKLTGRELLVFIGEIYEVPRPQLLEEIESYLTFFNLQAVAAQPIESYSHGMRQKIVMSAALLHHPDYLIVDEPMVGLDPRSARLVKNLFLKLAHERGTTLFLSTHSLDLAEEICDCIGILSMGRLIAFGSREELQNLASRQESGLEEIFLELTAEE
jgi:ABC-2 type transport system ATP-binding protein